MLGGPPYMNRKMTCFAFAAKCGSLGASGLVKLVGATEAELLSAPYACLAKKPSCSSMPVRARPVKPAPISQRNWRREPVQREVDLEVSICINPRRQTH